MQRACRYREAKLTIVGGKVNANYGGTCTCPDGQKYRVGDQNDDCGSLACYGGIPGPCIKGGAALEPQDDDAGCNKANEDATMIKAPMAVTCEKEAPTKLVLRRNGKGCKQKTFIKIVTAETSCAKRGVKHDGVVWPIRDPTARCKAPGSRSASGLTSPKTVRKRRSPASPA